MPRLRHRWIFLPMLVALLLSSFLGARWLLQPERLSGFLLQQIEDATGLTLTLSRPVDLGFWPDLHIELHGLQVQAPQQEAVLLRAEQVEIALPWSQLRTPASLHLRGIRLFSAQIHLPAMLAFFDTMDDDGPPAPLQLPQLDSPLVLRDVTVIGDDWQVEKLDLTLSALHAGEPSHLEIRGALPLAPKPIRFAAQLTTTPRIDNATLHLQPLVMDWVLDNSPGWRPHIEGALTWHPAGVLTFALHSQIPAWPASWPSLPLPDISSQSPTDVALHYQGDSAFTGLFTLSVAHGEDQLHAQMTLNDTVDWLSRDRSSPLPPLEGEMTLSRLHYADTTAQGIRLRVKPASDSP